jgi:hypothetical protein
MRHLAILTISLSTLAGCAYDLALTPRDGTPIGIGVAQQTSSDSGTLELTIGGKTYSGTWGTTPASDDYDLFKSHSFARRGVLDSDVLSDPLLTTGTLANGLLRSPDGASLRCQFRYGTSIGYGVCADDDEKFYDFRITR